MSGEKSRLAAGLLAILLGSFGAHKFYLGYTVPAVLMLSVTVVSVCLMFLLIGFFFFWIPFVIGVIEGILYLTKTDADFERIYVINKREWF